jgi:hypothetical protein
VSGQSKAKAGGTITAGAALASGADGRLVAASGVRVNTSDAGAASDPLIGPNVIGRGMTGAVANDVFVMSVQNFGIAVGVAPAVELQTITFGPATLTDAMGPGQTVQTVTGKTAGSTLTLEGDAFTNGFLALNAGGTEIVVGAGGPFAASTLTGTYRSREVLAGAINSPNLSPVQNSITVASGAVAPAPLDASYRAALGVPPSNWNIGRAYATVPRFTNIFGTNAVAAAAEHAAACEPERRPG